MSISFRCEKCQKKFKAAEDKAGKPFRCTNPDCQHVQYIPGGAPAAPSPFSFDDPPPVPDALDFDPYPSSAPAPAPAPAVAPAPAAPAPVPMAYAEPQARRDDHGHAPSRRTDVRPILPRNTSNCVSRAEALRDQIYDYFVATCKREGVEGLVVKSHPYVMPVSLSFECWVPHEDDPALRDRSRVVITIEPKEFHRFDNVLTIDMQDNQTPRKYLGVVDFTEEDAEDIVRHLLRKAGTRRPSFHFTKLRTHPLQFWRPMNKLVRLRQDFMPAVGVLLCFVGVLLMAAIHPVLLLVTLAGVGILIYCYMRPGYAISSGKPPQEPRLLLRLDSWQALIPELGRYADAIRADLMKEFSESRREGIQLADEVIWQWGVDGIEERRQLVGRLRRGQGFIHVYRYGDDLFVGWDTHVNAGDWMEKDVAAGIDPKTGEFCRVKTIQPAWHTPKEYDLIDTICLGEWIHGAVSKVVKRVIAEHNIDIEIDFKIERGERQGIVGRQQERQGGATGLFGRAARSMGLKREG